MVWTSFQKRKFIDFKLRLVISKLSLVIEYWRTMTNPNHVIGQDYGCGCSADARLAGEWTLGLFSAVGAATRNPKTGVSKSQRKRPVRNPDVGVVQHRDRDRWVNEPLFGLVAAWHTVMGPAFSDIRVHFLPTGYLEQAVNVPAIRVTATPSGSLCGRIDFPRSPLIKQE